jgi:hypothetical protein
MVTKTEFRNQAQELKPKSQGRLGDSEMAAARALLRHLSRARKRAVMTWS